jgi:hypothetical protein
MHPGGIIEDISTYSNLGEQFMSPACRKAGPGGITNNSSSPIHL